MPRKKSGTPRPKPLRLLHIATHLPIDPGELRVHCLASWEGIKTDQEHFPSPTPPAAEVEEALDALGETLEAAKNGSPADKLRLKVAADEVRDIWGQLARYVQRVLRGISPSDHGVILARVLMYVSNVGRKRPKQPLAGKVIRTGVVRLVALAVPDALTYVWEWSQNEVDWSTTTTGESYVTLADLTPGVMYTFRFRCFLRGNTTTDTVAIFRLMVT